MAKKAIPQLSTDPSVISPAPGQVLINKALKNKKK
jgi:hypothetical protein